VFERLWEETGCRTVIEQLCGARKHCLALGRAGFLTVLHRLFVSGSDRAEDYRIAGVDGLDLHYFIARWQGAGRNCRRRTRTTTPFAPRRLKDLDETARGHMFCGFFALKAPEDRG
jgi:hypothetical protein